MEGGEQDGGQVAGRKGRGGKWFEKFLKLDPVLEFFLQNRALHSRKQPKHVSRLKHSFFDVISPELRVFTLNLHIL